jgi:hypothetical protein
VLAATALRRFARERRRGPGWTSRVSSSVAITGLIDVPPMLLARADEVIE